MYFLSTIYDIRYAIPMWVAGTHWDLFIIIRTIIAMTLDNKAAKFECLLCYVCGLCNWFAIDWHLYRSVKYTNTIPIENNMGKCDASIQINFIFYLWACSLKALNKLVAISVNNLQCTLQPHKITNTHIVHSPQVITSSKGAATILSAWTVWN